MCKYGKIVAPPTELLKKDASKWGEKAQKAFDNLKESMTTIPVLALLDFSQPFELETNALRVGSGMS